MLKMDKKKDRKPGFGFFIFALILGGGIAFLIYFYPQIFVQLGFIKRTDASGRNYHLPDFGIPIPFGYQVHGIDVSRYQGEIDWKAVSQMNIRSTKISFVFIKASEGEALRDAFFHYNWQYAKEYGIIRGAYHFYNPDINSGKQADLFISQVALEQGDLPPVLDIEKLGKYPLSNLHKGLKNWLNIIEKHYRIRPIIYTNQNFYRDYLQGHFEDYPFWVARYGNIPPSYPKNKHWTFWQHSDQGLVNGIAGKVDFNVFGGAESILRDLCKP